ncbi:DUF2202 domain-containing protein [Methanoregula sp.]|uniref:DUF2202 domain-containing protein n=1 Tax=Methanoregula sp. TaxID=2052170 RepID=UPI003569BE13
MSRSLFIGVLFVVCLLVAVTGCTSQPAATPAATPVGTPVAAPVVVTPAVTNAVYDPAAAQKTFLALPQMPLNASETADILELQEAEKFICDLNAILATQHKDVPVFMTISNGSKVFMVADNVILQRYGLANPENALPGVFTNVKIQRAYNAGVNTGSMGVKDAIMVSATAEDMHIADLAAAIGRTDNTDLQFMYRQELAFARNNLRTLSQWLTAYGGVFTPTYISVDYYNALMNSPVEQIPVK